MINTCSPEFHSENIQERRERGREGGRGKGEEERWGGTLTAKTEAVVKWGLHCYYLQNRVKIQKTEVAPSGYNPA